MISTQFGPNDVVTRRVTLWNVPPFPSFILSSTSLRVAESCAPAVVWTVALTHASASCRDTEFGRRARNCVSECDHRHRASILECTQVDPRKSRAADAGMTGDNAKRHDPSLHGTPEKARDKAERT